ncbi:guanine nucleotide exchange factor DBS-like isoform X2 [Anthonomus grandis grandis]|nr:guanine nucleotide exchange factor DBS-like isoform X2 [Anthonomus grandis grandis]
MQSTIGDPLGVGEVVDLLKEHYAILTGGKSNDGCPIITFPDNNNFHMLSDIDYQRLMLYLTTVPTLQEADMGFHLIIDRRNDRWSAVKLVLLKISEFFPGIIHVVYVIRPASFLQKALSEVSNMLSKDEFKFPMIVVSTIEELHEYIDPTQLTTDLGGSLRYNNEIWVDQRIELEHFSCITQQVSRSLDDFTKEVNEVELPENVELTQELFAKQTESYSKLKIEILNTAKVGESLLRIIKGVPDEEVDADGTFSQSQDIGIVFTVERLLVQLEETEKTFDEFWKDHSNKLRNNLELRRFEQDFTELQGNFELSLRTMSEMTELGDTASRVETLIKEMSVFENLCQTDIQRAEEAVSLGELLIKNFKTPQVDQIQTKCLDLSQMKELLIIRLNQRKDALVKSRLLMETIEKANNWCSAGVSLLASQRIEECTNTPELAEKYIDEIKSYQNQQEFRDILFDNISLETKTITSQLVQRMDDIMLMCNKRICSLNKIALKHKRLNVQTPMADSIVPRQPLVGAPHPSKPFLKKAFTVPKMDKTIETELEVGPEEELFPHDSDDSVNSAKIGHVLSELLDTERVYVNELLCIIKGYREEADLPENQNLISPKAAEKFDVIFGNLDEIYKFHAEYFLKDLENCISSTDLIALCFVQKRETFLKLYSFYCQNITKSEQVRENSNELSPFFIKCQRKLGHKLPLAAYLLKPVQRITKYQLLLSHLLKYSEGKLQCCKELQQALDCMLLVLKCVNDSMHQISITGFPKELSQQGELLLQGSFSVWVENKKGDLRLRLKPLRRHLFLYQKSLVFCKPVSKTDSNKAMYQFKNYLEMSQIGLTETVKGDSRRFEVWLQGRQKVHIIQAANLEQKNAWVNEIKKVLYSQLEEIKGEKIKQYAAIAHKPLKQTTSWEKEKTPAATQGGQVHQKAMSCDSEPPGYHNVDEGVECTETENWSSDASNSDEEDQHAVSRGRYIALADYCAIGSSEVNMKEGDIVELLKVGCAGWWFVKLIGSSVEGWAPAAYLESATKKTLKNSSRSQDRLNEHH